VVERALLGLVLLFCLAPGPIAFAQSVQIDHEAIRATRIATAVRITEKVTLDCSISEAAL
jgi:hypothetical protein